jgi:hypothetical protein
VFVDRLCAPANWFVEVVLLYCTVQMAPANWFVVVSAVKTPPQTSSQAHANDQQKRYMN